MKKCLNLSIVALLVLSFAACKKESPVQPSADAPAKTQLKEVNACSAPPQLLGVRTVGSTSGSVYGHDIILHSSGRAALVGEFTGTADFDPGPGVKNLTADGAGSWFTQWFDLNAQFVDARKETNDILEVKDKQGNTFNLVTEDGITTAGSLANCGGPSKNYLLAKTSPAGNVLWKSMLKETEENGCITVFEIFVQIDSEDNIIVKSNAGWKKISPSGQTIPFNVQHNNYGSFILDKRDNIYFMNRVAKTISKYDKTGKWKGSMNIPYSNIDVDALGNGYITGNFSGQRDFDPGPGVFMLTAPEESTMFIMKLDANGRFIWARTIGTGFPAFPAAVKVEPSGKYIFVAGSFQGTATFPVVTGDVTITSKGENEAFIMALKQCN